MKRKVCLLCILTAILAVALTACNGAAEDNQSAGSQTVAAVSSGADDADKQYDATVSEASDDKTDNTAESEASDNKTDNSESGTIAEKPDNSADSGTVKSTVSDGYSIDGNIIRITKEGEYEFTGVFSERQIYVDAVGCDVDIILNGVELDNSSDSPIYIESAEDVTVKAAEGSINRLSDRRSLKADDEDETGSACIFSKEDLKLSGKGELIIEAQYNNGVHSKKDITVKNITLTITAPDNAIKGNDSITIESGTLTLTSTEGDGLKTKNTDISPKGKQRGLIDIQSGTVIIYAADDCIKASYDVKISESDDTIVKQFTYEK